MTSPSEGGYARVDPGAWPVPGPGTRAVFFPTASGGLTFSLEFAEYRALHERLVAVLWRAHDRRDEVPL
jgi:hypothetical protein